MPDLHTKISHEIKLMCIMCIKLMWITPTSHCFVMFSWQNLIWPKNLSKHYFRRSNPPIATSLPLGSSSPRRTICPAKPQQVLSHGVTGMALRAQGVEQASKFPRYQFDRTYQSNPLSPTFNTQDPPPTPGCLKPHVQPQRLCDYSLFPSSTMAEFSSGTEHVGMVSSIQVCDSTGERTITW